MTSDSFSSQKKKELLNSSQRTLLAIDSSTQLASVALSVKGELVYSEECFRQKSHSEWINGAIERAINHLTHPSYLPSSHQSFHQSSHNTWQALDLIAVTHGPGSFTGVRVATNLAKSIAYAKSKPLVSYSSLEVLAHQAVTSLELAPSSLVLPVINAFKNMVFFSLFQNTNGKLEKILEPQTIAIEALKSFIEAKGFLVPDKPIQVIGDGFQSYKNYLDPHLHPCWWRSDEPKDHPLASTLADITNDRWEKEPLLHWKELTPTYLRASAAEEARLKQSH